MKYTSKKIIRGSEVLSSFDSDTRIFRIECNGEYEEVCISKEDRENRNKRWETIYSAVGKLCNKLDGLRQAVESDCSLRKG